MTFDTKAYDRQRNKTPERIEWHKEWRAKNPHRQLLMSARLKARQKNIPFNLTQVDIVVPKVCPVLGITLEKGKGSYHDASPSLDRVIPELGYVKGNVVVVSWRANRIKNNATVDELRQIYEFYARRLG